MSLRVQSAPWFDADLQFRAAWYAEQGGAELADRSVDAVESTVRKIADKPQLGWRPYPGDVDLIDLYSALVERPFRKHIPLVGGIDLSPLALLVLLQIAAIVLGYMQAAVLR